MAYRSLVSSSPPARASSFERQEPTLERPRCAVLAPQAEEDEEDEEEEEDEEDEEEEEEAAAPRARKKAAPRRSRRASPKNSNCLRYRC